MSRFNVIILPAKVLSNGRHRIRISVAHNGQTRYIPTNYEVDSPTDVQNGQVVRGGNAGHINIQLRKILNEYQAIYDSIDDPDVYSCSQLLSVLKTKRSRKHKSYEDAFEEYMEKLESEDKHSSTKLFRIALSHFEDFMGSKDIVLETITPMHIVKFASYITKRGIAPATIKLYMSLIKVVLGYAIKMRYVSYEVHPYELYSMPTYQPRDIYLTIEQVKKLRDAELSGDIAIARDVWMLSFYLGGINLVDMLNYNFKNQTRIKYERQKTRHSKKDQRYTIFDLQPEAITIIKKYTQRSGRLAFGRFTTRSLIFQLISRKKDELEVICDSCKSFSYMAARKTFFQMGFDSGESTDILDYCVGHAISKRMAMSYVVIKPEAATACMRRVFDLLK